MCEEQYLSLITSLLNQAPEEFREFLLRAAYKSPNDGETLKVLEWMVNEISPCIDKYSKNIECKWRMDLTKCHT